MQNETLPQRYPADPFDDRTWQISGPRGRVVYNLLGNHLALMPAAGDADAVIGRTLARVYEYAHIGDDAGLLAVLADLYRTELAS